MITKRVNIFSLLLLFCQVLFQFSCGGNSNPEAEMREFPVTQTVTKDIETDLLFVADINAVQNVEIRARVSGYLEKMLVDEGHFVSKGQLLFQINSEEYQAAYNKTLANLKSAEAELKAAEVEKERVRLLVEKEVITKTENDLAQAKLAVALANIEQAKADAQAAAVRLEHASIRSPFPGYIDRIPYKLGSLINEGTLLTTISDLSSVYAYFKISEIEYLKYLKSHPMFNDSIKELPVELILADGTIFPQKGIIETMESMFEEGTGTLAIRTKFPNDKHMLKHGANGTIKIHRTLKGVILVPQKSAMEIQDRNYVFILTKQNTVMLRSFEILQRYKDFYIVKSGLKPGETIVYEGVQNLREGSVIKPKQVNPKEVYDFESTK